ncbi:Holliday junction branch migration protein RuvA [Kingella kingae]|uniref:Holliday junction branch migration protein RuvA n=1 Tax=Kingella kingae TaxID=504 RepID=UPI00040E5E4E|nr:Holliday junction branch migration protein RuvA [Kingella kingae]MDK4531127.1 Holliday junction branch migration protein RuvA [Kingella kingae]MDK4537131.1 Holliday junction branch migration protein RuvA [Kingella kingae]MDK4539534.1 Holliday junction branch migration protein RuvA [Kingella kingae]MDK4546527.1 Holliday junction branch migration protein RuvA [Kingella kingae]MDK4566433.1 Holliday junction branch migration protein RuvA [Kingella kingae]
MISRLRGVLLEKMPPQIVIDANGVGYELDVSMQTFYALPALGETVQLYTHLVVREDAHLLFGFGDASERTTFRQLIKVSGIGAKTALGILSAMTTDELAQAIANEDVKRLSSAPGIGKKTAERMILELRGKLAHRGLGDLALFTPAADTDNRADVVSTLLALGYSEREAQAACKSLPNGVEVGEGVRLALKQLMK